jgi:hypothetical protein
VAFSGGNALKEAPDLNILPRIDHPNVQFNYYRKGIGSCDVEMH